MTRNCLLAVMAVLCFGGGVEAVDTHTSIVEYEGSVVVGSKTIEKLLCLLLVPIWLPQKACINMFVFDPPTWLSKALVKSPKNPV